MALNHSNTVIRYCFFNFYNVITNYCYFDYYFYISTIIIFTTKWNSRVIIFSNCINLLVIGYNIGFYPFIINHFFLYLFSKMFKDLMLQAPLNPHFLNLIDVLAILLY